MVKRDSTIFLAALTKRAAVGMALSKNQGHRIQLLAIIPYESMVVPLFWVSVPWSFPSFSYIVRKGKRESGHWDAQGQVDSSRPLRP